MIADDTYEIYEKDIFDDLEDDYAPPKRRRGPRVNKAKTNPIKGKYTKKTQKLSKAVLDMQERYDAIAANKNATRKDWQAFFQSIEKFVMSQAYKINFNRYIEKTSDLWGYLTYIILESIIPKKGLDGKVSCWYIDPIKQKMRNGYNREQANIGNYLSNKVKWSVIDFNQSEQEFLSYCTDFDLDPVPDDDSKIDKIADEEDVYDSLPIKLEVRGQCDDFKRELNLICSLRAI